MFGLCVCVCGCVTHTTHTHTHLSVSLTRAEESDGFEVGVLLCIRLYFVHAVAELLKPPDVFHHLLHTLRRQFLCADTDTKITNNI